MSDSCDFGLIQSFAIDGGELDGLLPAHVFVLGFELGEVTRQFESGEPFKRLIHIANLHRIGLAAKRFGRRWRWMPCGDQGEEWAMLTCEATQ